MRIAQTGIAGATTDGAENVPPDRTTAANGIRSAEVKTAIADASGMPVGKSVVAARNRAAGGITPADSASTATSIAANSAGVGSQGITTGINTGDAIDGKGNQIADGRTSAASAASRITANFTDSAADSGPECVILG